MVDGIDFRPSRNGGGSRPAAAHSLRECGRAMARGRRQFSDLGLGFSNAFCGMAQVHGRPTRGGGVNPRCGDRDRRTPVDRLGPACAACRTLGTRSHRCLHACWRGRSMGQSFDHREMVRGAAPADAHSLCECGRAMARRRRPFADLGLPVTPTHAHILVKLVKAVDMTDFATENRCWECAGAGAQCARKSETDGATAQPVFPRWVSITPMHARHVGMGS